MVYKSFEELMETVRKENNISHNTNLTWQIKFLRAPQRFDLLSWRFIFLPADQNILGGDLEIICSSTRGSGEKLDNIFLP